MVGTLHAHEPFLSTIHYIPEGDTVVKLPSVQVWISNLSDTIFQNFTSDKQLHEQYQRDTLLDNVINVWFVLKITPENNIRDLKIFSYNTQPGSK